MSWYLRIRPWEMLCHRSNYEEIFLPNEYNQRPLKRDARIDPLWFCTLLGKDSKENGLSQVTCCHQKRALLLS